MTDSWRTALAKLELALQSRDLTVAERIRYVDAMRKRAREISRTHVGRPRAETWQI